MAVTTSKVTYSLKPQTVDRVQELAVLWGVPKSEVIQRAIARVAYDDSDEEKTLAPLEALEWFQENRISDQVAAQWKAEVLRERRAWGQKRK